MTLSDRTLLLVVGISSITALVSHLWYAVDVFFVQSSLHASAVDVGFLWALSSAGGMLGSSLLLLVGNPSRQKAWLFAGFLLRGASLIWYATMTRLAWALPAAFLAGLGDEWIIIVFSSLPMERAMPGIVGKVTAFSAAASALTSVLAMLGLLASWLPPFQLLLWCGLVLCLSRIGCTLGGSKPHVIRLSGIWHA